MATMYVYYQRIGGEEDWTPTQADTDLSVIKPTFVTVLAVDTLIEKGTAKEAVNKAKYVGPMYFDLDSDDIQESITDAKALVKNLLSSGLREQDLEIYLSGKKGLHILIPQECFLQRVQPTLNLPAIYKELAYSFAQDSVDMRVYTAKRGRMLRTCYNQRENGKYKVQITLAELTALTPESYAELASTPRPVVKATPEWSGAFAIKYDSAFQKVANRPKKVTKPTPPNVLKEQRTLFDKLASGQLKTEKGFNVIGMQLCLYAREAGWTEEQLLEACEGVIQNHESDGSRYNTPRRRRAELVRMFWYLQENPSFEYSAGGIKACIVKASDEAVDTGEDEKPADEPDFVGVYAGTTCYMVSRAEDGDSPISNFVFRNTKLLRDIDNGAITGIRADMFIKRFVGEVNLQPQAFTGGTALQNAVAMYGGSFSGTDVQARGVYQAMLKSTSKDELVLDSEGINVFKVGTGSQPKQEFVVWADREGVKGSTRFTESGIEVAFQAFPDPRGLFQTDLLAAPTLTTLCSTEEGRQRLLNCLWNLINAHNAEVVGKMIGWAAACFYAPLFHQQYKKFPLLHVYGPAGGGKTEFTRCIQRFFYHKEDCVETSPNSTLFAIQQLLNGSASIPVFMDEYKPHAMTKEKLDQIRALLRDAYNAKEVQRGGGSKGIKDNYNALNSLKMKAPLVFVAEAPETETAIVERAVMVSFRRLAGRQQALSYKHAMLLYKDTEPLASIGLEIASGVVAADSLKESLAPFDHTLMLASDKFLPSGDDMEKVERGEMSPEQMRLRSIMRPRTVFNSTVAQFGLQLIRNITVKYLGEDIYKEVFEERFKEMSRSCFLGMDTLAAATLPEYVKVLTVFSDMSKLPAEDPHRLVENVDYNLSELGGQAVIVIAAAQCYRKYRAYMRNSGTVPMYPSEEAFQIALREVPQFIKHTNGTKELEAVAMVFDATELQRAAVPLWKGKPVSMHL